MQKHISEKITSFPDELQDKNQVQRFLGCLNYAEGFIPNLAQLINPLQKLFRKKNPFLWKKALTQAVQHLKSITQTLPKLQMPIEGEPLILEIDASELYWGAVLKKQKDNQEYICRYTSGTFTDTESRYHSNEKE